MSAETRPYDWQTAEPPQHEAWPAGFSLARNPDGYDWTISLPAEFEAGCLDEAIVEALCINEALSDVFGSAAEQAPSLAPSYAQQRLKEVRSQ